LTCSLPTSFVLKPSFLAHFSLLPPPLVLPIDSIRLPHPCRKRSRAGSQLPAVPPQVRLLSGPTSGSEGGKNDSRSLSDHRMKSTHTCGMLACGHHFHLQCLQAGSPSPPCPLCQVQEEATPPASSSSAEGHEKPSSPTYTTGSPSFDPSLTIGTGGEENEMKCEG